MVRHRGGCSGRWNLTLGADGIARGGRGDWVCADDAAPPRRRWSPCGGAAPGGAGGGHGSSAAAPGELPVPLVKRGEEPYVAALDAGRFTGRIGRRRRRRVRGRGRREEEVPLEELVARRGRGGGERRGRRGEHAEEALRRRRAARAGGGVHGGGGGGGGPHSGEGRRCQEVGAACLTFSSIVWGLWVLYTPAHRLRFPRPILGWVNVGPYLEEEVGNVHRRPLILSSDYKIVPRQQNQIYGILDL